MSKLWTLHYHDKWVARQGLIEASTQEKAEELGREWVTGQRGLKYIKITDAILAREPKAAPAEGKKA